MRFAFIDAEKANHRIELLCRVLEVSRSGYYAWRSRCASLRAQRDQQLAAKIRALHKASKQRYGSPRIHRELVAAGEAVSRKRVARLMREQGLFGRRRRRFRKTTDSSHQQPIAPNLVRRRFTAAGPNQLWASDITHIRTRSGWLYLAVVLDVYSRRIVGWAMDTRLHAPLALTALEMAVQQRRPQPGGIHHSDRGGQYANHTYRRRLRQLGMRASMSRKGDCWDNAVVESFFATLKQELVSRSGWMCDRG